VGSRLAALARLLPQYLQLAWWGLAAPRLGEPAELVVVQAVVREGTRVLLAVRRELRGWELPGGAPLPGESDEQALCRELREETGLAIAVERRVGDYRRTGFRPHLARVFCCRVAGGSLRPSREAPRVAWFEAGALPRTLFPWHRGPLADALAARGQPIERVERQGLREILAGAWIDLRMRLSDDRAR